MTAPARIAYAAPNVYRLDPYVRDERGRFAPAPAVTPAPIALLEATAVVVVEDLDDQRPADDSDDVRVLYNGSTFVSGAATSWRVRVVREAPGQYRVVYDET